MDITIRLATSEELPQLIELQTRAIGRLSEHYNSQQILSLIDDQAFAREWGNETRFVAEVQGSLVGFAALCNDRWLIGGVYVDPNWMRRGIGSRLMAKIEEEAKQRPMRSLTVLSSLNAVPFYQSLGYVFQESTGFTTHSGCWVDCANLRKQVLPQESFIEWVERNRVLIGLGLLFLVLGFLFSRPEEPRQRQEIRVSTQSDRNSQIENPFSIRF